jgi:hypothetical protein
MKKKVVFFAQVGGPEGLILIDGSDNPNARVESLRVNKAQPVELLGVLDGDVQPVHRILNPYRVQGKPRWFHPHERLLAWVGKFTRLSDRSDS